MRTITLIVGVVLLIAAPVFAAPLTYLVNALDAKGDLPAAFGQTVTNQICADLAKADKEASVLCPDDIKAMLQAQGDLQVLGAEGGGAALDGQAIARLNADRGFSGTLSKVGNTVMLSLSMLDYKSGKALARGTTNADADDIKALLAKIPELLTDMFKQIKK